MPKKREWFEDDSLWQAVMPILFDEKRVESASGEVDDMIALTGIRPGSRVLDLCCGIGRHSIQFARRKFKVTGVDKTRQYIETAKRFARELGVKVNFVVDDMLHFRKEDYDLAISYFSSFGYFESRGADLKVAGNVAASLRDGGKFLIDILGKEIVARNYQRKNWVEAEDYVLLEERVVENGWTGIRTRWTIIRNGKFTELSIFHRLYSAVELIDLLIQAGFSDVKVYGDIKGRPYDTEASRLVAVAVK